MGDELLLPITMPPPALMHFLDLGLPWPGLDESHYVRVEAPACSQVAEVAAEHTRDGVARRFVCDKPAGHKGMHRHVNDDELDHATEWSVSDA